MPEIRDPSFLAELNGGGASPSAPAAPQPRQGLPVFTVPMSPQQQAEQARAANADQRAADAARLAQDAAARAAASQQQSFARDAVSDQRWAAEQGKPPSGYIWSPQGTLAPIPGGPADKSAPPKTDAQLEEARSELGTVIQAARKAKQLSKEGWFTTGRFSGVPTAPGSAQYDLDALLETIGANSAFSKLQEMRENSPTGGALGSITERELALLKNSAAAINRSQSKEQFDQNMDILIGRYERILGRLGGEPLDKAGSRAGDFIGATVGQQGDAAALPGAPAAPPAPPAGPGQPPQGVDRTSTFTMDGPDFTTTSAATGSTIVESDRDRQFAAAAQAIMDRGGTAEEANALAQQFGYQPQGGAPIFSPDQWQEAQTYNARLPEGAPRARIQVPQTGVNEVGAVQGAISGIAGSPVGAYFAGAGDAVTLGFGDEVASGLEAATTDKTYDQAVAENRLGQTIIREQNPGTYLAGQLSGALLLPTKVGGARATGGIRGAAVQASKEGAVYGGLYGAGSAEGGIVDRADDALLGGVLGGVGGRVLGEAIPRIPNALGSLLPSRTAARAAQSERNALYQASRDIGVDLLPADVGGSGMRGISAGLAQSPLSAGSITAAAERSQSQMQAATRTAGARVGSTLQQDEAGEVVRGAAQRFSKRSSEVGGKLYDRADRLARGVRIRPVEAIKVIDDEVARLSEAAAVNKPLIDELQKFKQALTENGNLSVSGMRDVRTVAGAAARTEALRATPAQRSLGMVQTALAKDIENGLSSVGRTGAVNAFRRADTFWKSRIEQIDEVLEPVIGRGRGGEQILQAVEGMSRGQGGGVARLRGMLNSLSANERGDIQATIIERLGRASSGTQDDAGSLFSASTFLTNWNAMTDKGKAVLFGRSGELRSNLDKIAKVASASKQAQKYANSSRTAGAANVSHMIRDAAQTAGRFIGTAGTAAAGVATVGWVPMVLAAGANYGLGKAFASPAFTKWLARAPSTSSSAAIQRYFDRLPDIAARNPAISSEVTQLYQRLTAAVNDNVPGYRAAASEGEQQQ